MDPVEQTTQTYSPPETPTSNFSKAPSANNSLYYLFAFAIFMLGLGVGFFLYKFSNPQVTTFERPTPDTNMPITLPSDAVQIQSCSNNKGALYVKPTDIPVGPVYMVNNSRVIGVEFMLSKDEFINGKSFKYLSGLGAKVDHVNIGLLSEGHEGYTIPHYHVDLYLVPKEVEESIKCPNSPTAPQPTNSPLPTTKASTSSSTPSN